MSSAPRRGLPCDSSGSTTSNKLNSNLASRPYAYDSDYEWLQGELAFDETDRSWSILYSDAPRGDDPYQGYLTLAHDQRLNRMRSGDIIRVRGMVDPVVRDRQNKRTYVASEVTLLQTAVAVKR